MKEVDNPKAGKGRAKLRAYQVLCHVLIHRHDFIELTATGWLVFRTSDLGSIIKLTNAKIYFYLEMLEQQKYIDSYYSHNGIVHVRPLPPKVYRYEQQIKEI